MNALAPRAPFEVLIVSESSRLGREMLATQAAMMQLADAGVRVWSYPEAQEIALDSALDKMLLSLRTFADELEREKARQRTSDAMLRKAKAGHVCGGRVFGYRNVDVLTGTDKDGRPIRSHVTRETNPDEAAVVRRIFELCAAGAGLARITKTLNAEGCPAPRAQQGRPRAWAASSVRAVLLHRHDPASASSRPSSSNIPACWAPWAAAFGARSSVAPTWRRGGMSICFPLRIRPIVSG